MTELACTLCGEPAEHVTRSGRCEECESGDGGGVRIRANARMDAAIAHPTLAFEKDYGARAFVVHHRDGATLDEVGRAIGVTRERVRQLEQLAFAKVRDACEREGIDAADLVRGLLTRGEEQAHPHAGVDTLVRVVDRRPVEVVAPHDPKSDPQSPEAVRIAELLEDIDRRADRVSAILATLPPVLEDGSASSSTSIEGPKEADPAPNPADPPGSGDALFDALLRLRDAADLSAPSLRAAWRTVDTAVQGRVVANARGFPDVVPDAHQVTMLAIVRSVARLRATAPTEASRWLWEICTARTRDVIRYEQRQFRNRERGLNGSPAELESLVGEPPIATSPPDPDLLWSCLAPHLEALADQHREPAQRMLTSMATFLRVIGELEADAIAARIAPGASRDLIYKWVERGRPMLLGAIARWWRSTRSDLERSIAAELEELVEVRRADVGIERPERRRVIARVADESLQECA